MGEVLVPHRVAAIDCGTNSTRLLVGEATGAPGPFRSVDRRMTITRMGEGVDASGRLNGAAMARVLDVLGEYRTVMDRHRVMAWRIQLASILVVHKDYPSSENLKIRVLVSAIP